MDKLDQAEKGHGRKSGKLIKGDEMKTILLTAAKIHPEWKLFDPFFYHHQSTEKLVYITFQDWENSDWISGRILQEIRTGKDENWQLFVVETLESPVTMQNRLSYRLAKLKEKVINILEKKEAGPASVTVFLLDYIHRDGKATVEDQETLMTLSLDQRGFVPYELHGGTHPEFWLDEELKQLDEAWGPPLKLSSAGPLQNPDQPLLNDIETRKTRVSDRLKEKNDIIKDHTSEVPFYDMDTFSKEFCHKMTEETSIPLNERVEHFKPSVLAKSILNNYIAQKAFFNDMRMIRQEVSHHSKKQRYRAWLEVIFFIHLAIEDEDLTKNIQKGQMNSLQGNFNKEFLNKLLLNYEASLNALIYHIENRLLSRDGMMMKQYEMAKEVVTSLNNDPSIADEEQHEKLRKKWDIREVDRLKVDFDSKLDTKEIAMENKVKESLRSIKIFSRKSLNYETEEIEMYDYLNTLTDLENHQKMEMEKHTPSLALEKTTWDAFIHEVRFNLNEHFKAYPSRKKVIVTSMLVWLGISGPLLMNISSWPNVENWSEWILPIISTGAVIGLAVLGLKRLRQPVTDTLKDIDYKKDRLQHEQHDRHIKTTEYLNDYFQLERMQKIKAAVKSHLSKEQRENILLRYHLKEAKEALNGFRHMRDDVIDTDMEEPQHNMSPFINERFSIEKDVVDNLPYSPVGCSLFDEDGRSQTEVMIGKMKKTMESGHFPIFNTIKLDKDQVEES